MSDVHTERAEWVANSYAADMTPNMYDEERAREIAALALRTLAGGGTAEGLYHARTLERAAEIIRGAAHDVRMEVTA